MAKEEIFTEIDEIACIHFLIKGNQTQAYLLYRRLRNMGEVSETTVRGQASLYFQKDMIKRYIKYELEKLAEKFSNGEPISIQGTPDRVNLSNDKDYSKMSDEEIREIALQTLFYVKDSPDSSSSDRITAVKNITDIMNAKKNDKPLSETEKFIHYILPAEICESCDRKSEIYKEHGYEATEEEIKEAFYSNKTTKKVEDEDEK